jgi:hypothetical protein
MKAIDNSNYNNGFYESVLLFWTGFCNPYLTEVVIGVEQLQKQISNKSNTILKNA